MTRHDLGSDQWVELREPEDVPERLRQPIKLASAKLASYPGLRKSGEIAREAGVTDAESLKKLSPEVEQQISEELGDAMEHLDRVQKLTILSRVSAWSFSPNVTMDALLDLPARYYDQIQDLSGSVSEQSPDLELSPDPKADTQLSTV